MEVIVSVQGAPKPVGAYSAAVKSGEFIFCAGQIGLDPETGKLVEGGVESEAKRVLENLKAVLEGSGSNFGKVVMTTIFLTDISTARQVNEIYKNYVSTNFPPARQTVAVKDLPLGAQVEISIIAGN